jgi:hypothetical protein
VVQALRCPESPSAGFPRRPRSTSWWCPGRVDCFAMSVSVLLDPFQAQSLPVASVRAPDPAGASGRCRRGRAGGGSRRALCGLTARVVRRARNAAFGAPSVPAGVC